MIYLLIFVFGLAWGSALYAFAYRFYHKQSWVFGRSACPVCKKHLTVLELIPLISFVIQKRRCRHCQTLVSWRYPLAELVTAIALGGGFWWLTRDGITMEALFVWAIFFTAWSVWFIIFVHDFLYTLVFDSIAFFGVGLIAAMQIAYMIFYDPPETWLSRIGGYMIGMIIGAGFFALQFIISRGRWIGGGDIRLGLLMGMTLGWPHTLTALIVAYIGGSVVSIILLAGKRVHWKSEIPFGTFLACATIGVLLFGDSLVRWYIGLFY